LSLAELREVVTLAIDHPGDWKWIATHLSSGGSRSPAIIQNAAVPLLNKLKELGLEIESGREIECVPDAVFDLGGSIGIEREELVRQFEAKRAELRSTVQPLHSDLSPPPPAPLRALLRRISVPPPPPSTEILLSGSATSDEPRRFRECDDQRLRAIVSGYRSPIRPSDWKVIATEFGCGLSVRQLRDRWFNYARPDLDGSPLSLAELRVVVALAIDHPGCWKWIATHLSSGRCRSVKRIQYVAVPILKKMRELGLEIESGRDVQFVPDAVFDTRRPTGIRREELIAQFKATKAQHTAPASAPGTAVGQNAGGPKDGHASHPPFVIDMSAFRPQHPPSLDQV
jgi:hypothetical protein